MRTFAILLVWLAAAVPSMRAQPSGVSAELQLDQDQFLPGEDLQLKVRIVNRSGQPVVLGADNDWINFDIAGQSQNVADKLGEMPVKGPFTLLSGEAVTREFNPTPYLDFQHAGHYTLGAMIKIAQWKQAIACKPLAFEISDGVPLTRFENLAFGVPPPPGVTNAAPVVRRYSLLKVTTMERMKLYFRLTDSSGRTLRVYPLGPVVSFGDPEAQLDHANNFHILFQTGARTFNYSVVDPNGTLLARQFHTYTQSRPTLNIGDNGQVFVIGGRRMLTMSDVPAPQPATAGNQ